MCRHDTGLTVNYVVIPVCIPVQAAQPHIMGGIMTIIVLSYLLYHTAASRLAC